MHRAVNVSSAAADIAEVLESLTDNQREAAESLIALAEGSVVDGTGSAFGGGRVQLVYIENAQPLSSAFLISNRLAAGIPPQSPVVTVLSYVMDSFGASVVTARTATGRPALLEVGLPAFADDQTSLLDEVNKAADAVLATALDLSDTTGLLNGATSTATLLNGGSFDKCTGLAVVGSSSSGDGGTTGTVRRVFHVWLAVDCWPPPHLCVRVLACIGGGISRCLTTVVCMASATCPAASVNAATATLVDDVETRLCPSTAASPRGRNGAHALCPAVEALKLALEPALTRSLSSAAQCARVRARSLVPVAPSRVWWWWMVAGANGLRGVRATPSVQLVRRGSSRVSSFASVRARTRHHRRTACPAAVPRSKTGLATPRSVYCRRWRVQEALLRRWTAPACTSVPTMVHVCASPQTAAQA